MSSVKICILFQSCKALCETPYISFALVMLRPIWAMSFPRRMRILLVQTPARRRIEWNTSLMKSSFYCAEKTFCRLALVGEVVHRWGSLNTILWNSTSGRDSAALSSASHHQGNQFVYTCHAVLSIYLSNRVNPFWSPLASCQAFVPALATRIATWVRQSGHVTTHQWSEAPHIWYLKFTLFTKIISSNGCKRSRNWKGAFWSSVSQPEAGRHNVGFIEGSKEVHV
jgi:hypothetical protein